jgi:3D (Asp-Asp-Asp) domain-containing protein
VLADSFSRKALVTLVAVGGLVWVYEAPTFDSLLVSRLTRNTEPGQARTPAEDVRPTFIATAYCKGHVTSTGVAPRPGVAAADPAILPAGSIVEIAATDRRFDGVYSILDTGPLIRGRRIDLYLTSCRDAVSFGRQSVRLKVVRNGWNPTAGTRRSESPLPPLLSPSLGASSSQPTVH